MRLCGNTLLPSANFISSSSVSGNENKQENPDAPAFPLASSSSAIPIPRTSRHSGKNDAGSRSPLKTLVYILSVFVILFSFFLASCVTIPLYLHSA